MQLLTLEIMQQRGLYSNFLITKNRRNCGDSLNALFHYHFMIKVIGWMYREYCSYLDITMRYLYLNRKPTSLQGVGSSLQKNRDYPWGLTLVNVTGIDPVDRDGIVVTLEDGQTITWEGLMVNRYPPAGRLAWTSSQYQVWSSPLFAVEYLWATVRDKGSLGDLEKFWAIQELLRIEKESGERE